MHGGQDVPIANPATPLSDILSVLKNVRIVVRSFPVMMRFFADLIFLPNGRGMGYA